VEEERMTFRMEIEYTCLKCNKKFKTVKELKEHVCVQKG
jgi:DNA-directed RNA polymerase subunit RPC12/RpoP